jgi:hypothetical protein
LEYEADVVADMDIDNNMIISKTRCAALSGQVFAKPGEEIATVLRDWLDDGAERQLPKCEDCGKDMDLIPGFTVEQIAAKSKEKFGRALCKGCRPAKQATQDTPAAATSTVAPADPADPVSPVDEKTVGDKCREAQMAGSEEPVTGDNAKANGKTEPAATGSKSKKAA